MSIIGLNFIVGIIIKYAKILWWKMKKICCTEWVKRDGFNLTIPNLTEMKSDYPSCVQKRKNEIQKVRREKTLLSTKSGRNNYKINAY